MKKLICLVLAAMMIFALVACNATQGSDIDELKQRITQLEDKNKELEDELHNQKLKYDDKLTQQERKFEDELKKQEGKNKLIEELLSAKEEDKELLEKKLENLMGREIKFTAKAPELDVDIQNSIEIKSFFERALNKEEVNETFGKFFDYAQNEFMTEFDYDFYFLNPLNAYYGWNTYAVFAESYEESAGMINNPVIYESFSIYNKVLGDATLYRSEKLTNYHAVSVAFEMYLKPLPDKSFKAAKNLENYLRLEFGNTGKQNYINIYVSDTCIGTCFYSVNAYVSHTWFEKYFIKNLI